MPQTTILSSPQSSHRLPHHYLHTTHPLPFTNPIPATPIPPSMMHSIAYLFHRIYLPFHRFPSFIIFLPLLPPIPHSLLPSVSLPPSTIHPRPYSWHHTLKGQYLQYLPPLLSVSDEIKFVEQWSGKKSVAKSQDNSGEDRGKNWELFFPPRFFSFPSSLSVTLPCHDHRLLHHHRVFIFSFVLTLNWCLGLVSSSLIHSLVKWITT